MNRDELLAALAPVKSYFHGSEVSSSTVLAAWMRRAGLAPNGSEWIVARSAVLAGRSFKDAVDLAMQQDRKDRTPAPVPSIVERERPAPAAPRRAMPPKQPEAELRDGFPVLRQHSKPRTSGDLDGDGARRLLGAFELDPISVLVRETAQNSWDARLRSGTRSLELVYNLWRADEDQARLLRENLLVGTEGLPKLQHVLLGRPWLLEISDRGTKGLGGPTRNDKPSSPGVPTDYMDLVLNLGAPRDVAKGGGTYGFGKTITYTISEAETVLIWTHSEHDEEYRLIGSAMGRSFDDGDSVFTGRHWWGTSVPEGDRVEPITGELASGLGARVFRRGFGHRETGTSLLIIAPDFGDRSPEEFVNGLRRAVLRELWPKLVPHDSVHPMAIRLFFEGEERSPRLPDEQPLLKHYAKCLDMIRDRESGVERRAPLAAELIEIRGGHGDHLIGHLAIAHLMESVGDSEDEDAPLRRIALMRNEAELVVSYHRVPGTIDAGDSGWVGVFKPIGDTVVDNEFAMAEPPTHDSWVVAKGFRGHSRVRIAFRRIKEHVDKLLKPKPDRLSVGELSSPTAALATALAGLVPIASESGRARRTQSAASTGRKLRAQVGDRQIQRSVDGMVQWVVVVTLEGAPTGQGRVHATAVLATDGDGRPDLDDSVCRIVGWRDPQASEEWEVGSSTMMRAQQSKQVLVEFDGSFAADIRFKVVAT